MKPRILLLLAHQANRRLLTEWLAGDYEVLDCGLEIADGGLGTKTSSREEISLSLPDNPPSAIPNPQSEQSAIKSPALTAEFDLGIVDGPALDQRWEQVQARKEAEQPVALPFLLITSRLSPGTILPHLWHTIDEVIRVPVEKVELRARVEMLLRVRRLSQALHQRAEDLAARLGRVLDDSPNEIYIFDAASLRIVQVNHGACRNLGYTLEEMLQLTPLDLSPELTQEEYAALLQPLRTGEQSQIVFETTRRRKDGTSYPVEVRIELSQTETVPVFVAIAQDITARKQAAQELEAAHQQRLQAEREQKRFAFEVIRAVTKDKFLLVDPDEIPVSGELLLDVPVRSGQEYEAARAALLEAAPAAMPRDRLVELVQAAAEAITNAFRHGTNGRCQLYQTDDALLVRVSDTGPGIRWQDLPATILTPGFSTKVSLGMGFTLMLNLADRVWLSTGPEGTVIQLEKLFLPQPEADIDSILSKALE